MHTFDSEDTGEKSLQALYMDINRHYTEKCLGQIRELGIQPGQMPVIMILGKSDGCSQRSMAEILRNKPSTVNVSIQRLEKSGIVCRRRDEKDQRIMRVYLTEQGRQTVADLRRRVVKMEKILFGNFSETELCLLRRFFLQILENIDHMPGPAVDPRDFMEKEGVDHD